MTGKFNIHYCFREAIIYCSLLIFGCASIPKEVVELSYTVGKDLTALHSSYRTLIQSHFQGLRSQTIIFLETRWIPTYLRDFIKEGELIESAKGEDPKVVLEDVQIWTEVALEEIEDKKREMLEPINNDEKELLNIVDDAFTRIINANAVITAHLNSLRKVQEVQDEALASLELKDLRDRINDRLISASDKAQNAIEKMKKVEGVLDEVKEKKDLLIKKLK